MHGCGITHASQYLTYNVLHDVRLLILQVQSIYVHSGRSIGCIRDAVAAMRRRQRPISSTPPGQSARCPSSKLPRIPHTQNPGGAPSSPPQTCNCKGVSYFQCVQISPDEAILMNRLAVVSCDILLKCLHLCENLVWSSR